MLKPRPQGLGRVDQNSKGLEGRHLCRSSGPTNFETKLSQASRPGLKHGGPPDLNSYEFWFWERSLFSKEFIKNER